METPNRTTLDLNEQYTATLEADGSLVITSRQEGHDAVRLGPEQTYTLFAWLHDHHRSTSHNEEQQKPNIDQGLEQA